MREQASLAFHGINAYKSHFEIAEILLRVHIFSNKILNELWICIGFLSVEEVL
jgi:hypothetical protein